MATEPNADSRPAGPPAGASGAAGDDEARRNRVYVGSAVVPPDLDKEENRRKWGLPASTAAPGEYMVELNIQHTGGLPSADVTFLKLYEDVVSREARELRGPVRVGKTYYSCWISLDDVRRLVAEDERRAVRPGDRAIYRVWPDFPVHPQIDSSVATVKADAAFRSYEASGTDVVWAVIDSGISETHPHFGDLASPDTHTLRAPAVAELHRCFSRIVEVRNGLKIPMPLADPDTMPAGRSADAWNEERKALLDKHIANALTDPYGHGTHVAGIIAGGLGLASERGRTVDCHAYERVYKADDDGQRLSKQVVERPVRDQRRLRGVAPNCRLVSLRVLDDTGGGRASDIIRALQYIREKLNDDPKLLRVHGVNLSVGYEFDAEMFACGQSPLCAEVDRLVQSGVVVVTAAGNTGYGTLGADQRATKVGISNTINDPGNSAGAITVGATHRSAPHTYGVSYFSSKGPTADGRLKPDLVAPGERITSCAAGAKLTELQVPLPVPRDTAYYVDDSGTSMAAPHVSGAIAAFLSIRQEFKGKPLEVKRIFLESATPLGRERYFEGHGLLDLMRAIQSV
jgi:subtilisin family serine protease